MTYISTERSNTRFALGRHLTAGDPANQVLLGDCVRVMACMPAGSVDCILTDPPYLVGYRDRSGRTVANDDTDAWMDAAFAQMYRVLKNDAVCVSCYSWSSADRFLLAWRKAGFRPVGHIVFAKPYASSQRFVRYHHELAYVLAKGHPRLPARPPSDVIPWRYTGNRLHPTQKPVSIFTPLLAAFTNPGDIVLDPFAGSGSTLRAAQLMGRRCVGIELDPTHHRTASRRLRRRSPFASSRL